LPPCSQAATELRWRDFLLQEVNMSRIALLLLALAAPLAVPAAEPPKYAVLSLAGDVILITQFTQATGTRLGTNPRHYVPVSDGILDKTVLLAANEKLRARDGVPPPVLLLARDSSLYEAQTKLLDNAAGWDGLIELVRRLAGPSGATQLILVTKQRQDARIALDDMVIGTGQIEGFGFYIDPVVNVVNTKTLDSGTGILAPFAYMRVCLVDLSSGRILHEERVAASIPHMAPAWKTEAIWNAMTPADKMRSLQELIRRETGAAIERLFASANAPSSR
jgi:hypothetical protein